MARASKKTTDFKGAAKPLTAKDYERAAERLSCEVAAIKAVSEVESGGKSGFLSSGQPKILFESRWFHKLTDGKYDRSQPNLSTPTWVRNYKGGAKEYDRLQKAVTLNRDAALKSASWGKFQILGINHKLCGFDTAEAYVMAQLPSEGAHLDAFVNFVIAKKLDDELRDLRWADFARIYNGPGYRQNRYDEKMAEAYAKHADGWIAPTTAELQRALNRHGANLAEDGITGRNTRTAITDFQQEAGLPSTGIADRATLEALGLGGKHDPILVS